MARYGLAATKSTTAAAGMICQLRAGSARPLKVYEVTVTASTAVSGTVALVRPTAVGSGFTSTAAGVAEDPTSGAGAAVIDTAASTAPTVGTVYNRQVVLPATIGAGVTWQWWSSPTGIVVPVSGSIALWQTSTAAVGYVVQFVYDE